MRAETRMLVSSTTRASGFVSFALGIALGADLAHRFVDDALQLVGVGRGVAFPDVLYSAMKHPPADGLLYEFRQIALLGALGTQKSAQSEVGLFRDLNVPAYDALLFHFLTPIHLGR